MLARQCRLRSSYLWESKWVRWRWVGFRSKTGVLEVAERARRKRIPVRVPMRERGENLRGGERGRVGRAQRPLSRGSHSLRYPARDSRPLGRPKYPTKHQVGQTIELFGYFFWQMRSRRVQEALACARRPSKGDPVGKGRCFFSGTGNCMHVGEKQKPTTGAGSSRCKVKGPPAKMGFSSSRSPLPST